MTALLRGLTPIGRAYLAALFVMSAACGSTCAGAALDGVGAVEVRR